MLFTERWKKMEIARVGILLDDDAFAGALAAELTRQARDMRFRLLHTAEEGRDCHMVLFSGSYTGKGGVELIFDPGEENLDGEPFRGVSLQEQSGYDQRSSFYFFPDDRKNSRQPAGRTLSPAALYRLRRRLRYDFRGNFCLHTAEPAICRALSVFEPLSHRRFQKVFAGYRRERYAEASLLSGDRQRVSDRGVYCRRR